MVCVCMDLEGFLCSYFILFGGALKCQIHKDISVLDFQHGKREVFEVGIGSWSCYRFFVFLDLHKLFQVYTSNEIMVALHPCTKGSPSGCQYNSLEACFFSCCILLFCWLAGHPVWGKARDSRNFHSSEVLGGSFCTPPHPHNIGSAATNISSSLVQCCTIECYTIYLTLDMQHSNNLNVQVSYKLRKPSLKSLIQY